MKKKLYVLVGSMIAIVLMIACKKRNVDQYVDTTSLSTFKVQSKGMNPYILYSGVLEQLQVNIESKSMKWLMNDVVYYLECSNNEAILLKEDGTPITPQTPLYYTDTLLFFEVPNVEIEEGLRIKLIAKDLKDPIHPEKVVFEETFNFELLTSDLVVIPAFLSKELFIEGTEDSAVFVIFSNATHHDNIYASMSMINLTANPAINFTQNVIQEVENTRLATEEEIAWVKKVMGIDQEENINENFPMYISSFTVPFKCLSGVGNTDQIDLKVTSKQSVADYIDTIHISASPFEFSAVMIPKVFVLQPNVPLPYAITVSEKKDPKGKAMRNGFTVSFESNNTNYFKMYKGNDTLAEKTGIYNCPNASSLYKLLDTLYYTQYNGGDGTSENRKGTSLSFTISNGATKKTFQGYSVNIYEPLPKFHFSFNNFYATKGNVTIEDNMYVSGTDGNLILRALPKKGYIYIQDQNPYALYNMEIYKTNLYNSISLIDYKIYSNENPSVVETLDISLSYRNPIINTLPIINNGKGFPTNKEFWCTAIAQDNVVNLSDLTGIFELKGLLYRAYPVWDPTHKDRELVEAVSATVKVFSNP